MEILQLLSSYEWEAKIAIVLASFVVDYAQFSHATKLYRNNRLGELIAILKQIPDNIDDIFDDTKSKFKTIIEVSVEVTRLIANFSSLSPKYISNDVVPMAFALDLIPIAVHLMTRSVVACASHLTENLGQSEISSSTKTWEHSSLENDIIGMRDTLRTKLKLCNDYIDEKKQIKYVEKLKLKFNQTTVYVDNQKILQLIIKNKDGSLPLASGLDNKHVGVEALKGKTVLLFISDLDIPHDDEIFMLSQFYQESRENPKQQFEIVWLPIMENIEQDENLELRFVDLKSKMPWYSLQNPSSIKPAVVKFMKEEWHYSKKNPILVALDPRGKMVNRNAFEMVWKWGNTSYPFTKRCELDIWNHKKWSLELLVEGIDQNISNWIKEEKVICLYGSNSKHDDANWIREFVAEARKVANDAAIELEMVYISKNTSQELTEILAGHSHYWKPETTSYFWKRIQTMEHPKTYKRAKIAAAKDAILVEMQNMHKLYHSGKSWALISQGARSGAGKIVKGLGDVILRGLHEFKSWSSQLRNKDFVMALNGHLAGRQLIPETDFCSLCHRAM